MRSRWEGDRGPEDEHPLSAPLNPPAECLTCGSLLSEDSDTCDICGSPIAADRMVFGKEDPDLRIWFEAGVLESPKASLWRRSVAAVVDVVVVAVMVGLVYGPVVGLVSSRAAALLCIAIVGTYFVVPYSTRGQTIGKSWLGIRVVSVDGSPLTWRQGLNRFLGYLASTTLFMLGYLWAVWDKDRQAWHDKLASTLVVPAGSYFIPTLDTRAATMRERKWVVAIQVLLAALALLGYRFSLR